MNALHLLEEVEQFQRHLTGEVLLKIQITQLHWRAVEIGFKEVMKFATILLGQDQTQQQGIILQGPEQLIQIQIIPIEEQYQIKQKERLLQLELKQKQLRKNQPLELQQKIIHLAREVIHLEVAAQTRDHLLQKVHLHPDQEVLLALVALHVEDEDNCKRQS